MANATDITTGEINLLPSDDGPNGYYIKIPYTPSFDINTQVEAPSSQTFRVKFQALPDISDSKGATYNDENVIGRSNPIKTYSYSNNRTISVDIHLYVITTADIQNNLNIKNAISSCVYPDAGNNSIYVPPPVCSMQFGKLLGTSPLSVVLQNYSVKYPTDVPWDVSTGLPWRFSISTTWDVVYASSNLPGQNKIIQGS